MLKNNFKKSVILISLLSIMAGGAAYVVRMVLSRTLSAEEYGFIYSLLGLFSIITVFSDLSFVETLNYFGPKYLKNKRYKDFNLLFQQVIVIRLTAILLIGSLIYWQADFLAEHYFHYLPATLYLQLFLVYFFITYMAEPFYQIFNSTQSFLYSSIREPVRWTTILVCSILFIATISNNILGVCLAWITSSLVFFLTGFFLMRFYFREILHFYLDFDFSIFKQHFYYAIPALAGTGCWLLINRMDLQLITFIRTLKEVSLYSNAYSIASIPLIIFLPISEIILPLTSKLHHNNQLNQLESIVTETYKLVFYFLTPTTIFFSLFSTEILLCFYGSFYQEGNTTLVLLSIGILGTVLSVINFAFLAGLGLIQVRKNIIIQSFLFSLGCSLILINLFGNHGAAAANVCIFTWTFLFSLQVLKKHVPIHLDLLFFTKLSVLNFSLWMIMHLLKKVIVLNPLYSMLITGLAGLTSYVLAGYLLKIYTFSDLKYLLVQIKKT